MLGIISRIKSRQLTELDRYTVSILGVLCSLVIKYAIQFVFKIEVSAFLMGFWPVAFAAWIGGWKIGLFTALLEALLVRYFFIPPRFTVYVAEPIWNLRILFFVCELLIINTITSSARAFRLRTRALSRDLTNSLRRFKLLSEQVQGYAFFFLSAKGRVIDWNMGSTTIFGLSQPTVMGKTVHLLFPRIGNYEFWRKQLSESRKKGSAETEGWVVTPEEVQRWLHVIITPLYDTTGELEGFGVICRDRSERKEIEQEKDKFIDDASHELKTPVTSIKLFTQILERQHQSNPKNAEIFGKLNNQLNTLTELVNMILDISRLQTGRLEPQLETFTVKELIESAIQKFKRRGSNRELLINTITSTQDMVGDKARLTHSLALLLFSIDSFAEAAEPMSITTQVTKRQIKIMIGEFEDSQIVAQQDRFFPTLHGTGLPAQKNTAGLGFGLYFSYQIITMHGGSLKFVKTKGGTQLVVTIPTMPHKSS